jgi:hypothetical protein
LLKRCSPLEHNLLASKALLTIQNVGHPSFVFIGNLPKKELAGLLVFWLGFFGAGNACCGHASVQRVLLSFVRIMSTSEIGAEPVSCLGVSSVSASSATYIAVFASSAFAFQVVGVLQLGIEL